MLQTIILSIISAIIISYVIYIIIDLIRIFIDRTLNWTLQDKVQYLILAISALLCLFYFEYSLLTN